MSITQLLERSERAEKRIELRNRDIRAKEKKLRQEVKKTKAAEEAMSTALTVPTPDAVERIAAKGKVPVPEGRSKHVFDTLEKCIVLAKASEDTPDKSRLEALVEKIYLMAMQSADLDEVLETAKFIAERLEGKPQSLYGGASEPSGGHSLTVNIGTRFSSQKSDVEVVSITEDK
jgi:hypothetical protein